MYKGASDLAQARNGRQVIVDAMVAGGRAEIQSFADELASVQAALRDIDRKIVRASDKAERHALGARKRELADRSKALKEKLRGAPRARTQPHSNFGSYFIDAAKARLTKPLFDIIMREAVEARKADEDAAAMSAPATDPDVAA